MLIFHDEAKNASANATAETVKGLPLRTDMKRGRFFLMKWAERSEVGAGAFQRKVGTNHFYDVVRSRDLFDGFRRNHRGFYFSLVCSPKRCQNLLSAQALFKKMKKLSILISVAAMA